MQAEIFTNFEVANNLDSSEAFEGPEKTLRIYFAAASLPSSLPPDAHGSRGLLKIPRPEWERMLDLVKCKVLSTLVHPSIHAYVLSESSLFVHPDHIILKTCGTTTLLAGVPTILEIVEKFKDLTHVGPTVTAAFYSRRSYFNPEKQCHPHGCWDDEVCQLKRIFKGRAFASHFGVNRDERWHLFTHSGFSPNDAPEPPAEAKLHDGWLELMMTGLDPDLAAKFYINSAPKDSNLEDSVLSLDSVASAASAVGAEPDNDDPGHAVGNVMTRTTRIDELFQSDKQCIDSFAFSPCGYSCNGVLLEKGKYFTIHVTPEKGFSYASFETNVEDPSQIEKGLTKHELIERVLSLFHPAKLTLVTCSPGKEPPLDPNALFHGKYVCTSEANFDIGSATIVQLSLQKADLTT